MKTKILFALFTMTIMLISYSCNEKEVIQTDSEDISWSDNTNQSSGFRDEEPTSISLTEDTPYTFRSLTTDGTQTNELTITLDGDGIVTVGHALVTKNSSDKRMTEVQALGVVEHSGESKTFVADENQDAWVIPFSGDEPFLHSAGGSINFLITCDCVDSPPSNPIGSCTPTWVAEGNGHRYFCNKVSNCNDCRFESHASVGGAALIISNAAIDDVVLE